MLGFGMLGGRFLGQEKSTPDLSELSFASFRASEPMMSYDFDFQAPNSSWR